MPAARRHAPSSPSATDAAAANAAMSAAASPRCRAARTPPTAIAATPATHTTAANATTQIVPDPRSDPHNRDHNKTQPLQSTTRTPRTPTHPAPSRPRPIPHPTAQHPTAQPHPVWADLTVAPGGEPITNRPASAATPQQADLTNLKSRGGP